MSTESDEYKQLEVRLDTLRRAKGSLETEIRMVRKRMSDTLTEHLFKMEPKFDAAKWESYKELVDIDDVRDR